VDLSKNSGVDQTLEIVKDAEKFKVRITELAKAEAGAKASTDKAKARNTLLNEEMDTMVKNAENKARMAQARSSAADKAAEVAMKPVIEAQAQADRLNKAVASREERAKKYEEGLQVDTELLREREVEFAEKVKNFQNAVNEYQNT
jgi:hypothetical protein